MNSIEIWKFIAGLGFFLYGMGLLELVLKNNSSRSVKLFLKRNTQSLFKSITGGALITGLVQSSSVVSLIVLAFVESGIITFKNALGVILGTNLGTTLDSWIVASIGFKFDMLNFSFPIIGISSLGLFIFEKKKSLKAIFSILLALGILFLGLSYMKESALVLVKAFDIASYTNYGILVFVLIGFVITTIIQSSSATIAITLTALYSGALGFSDAAAVVIGSEVGTSIKILLWGMKGGADKKRVAWSNFYYNIFTTLIALLLLKWLVYFIENIMHINNNLIGLVFFQTSINIISIILFIPFIRVFTKWMEKKFLENDRSNLTYFSLKPPLVSVMVADSIKGEAETLFKKTLEFIQSILVHHQNKDLSLLEKINENSTEKIETEYIKLKQTEGDILDYFTNLDKDDLVEVDLNQIHNAIHAIRSMIYAAKSVHDIFHNLIEFNSSAHDLLHSQINEIQTSWLSFQKEINIIWAESLIPTDTIDKLVEQINQHEKEDNLLIMKELRNDQLSEFDSSTLLNVHREIISSKKALLTASQLLKAKN